MFENILLEREQEALLFTLVEAHRNVPSHERRPFLAVDDRGTTSIHHPGLPNGKINAYMGDIDYLVLKGFLILTCRKSGIRSFDLDPQSSRYYEYAKQQAGQPVQRIEAEIRNYLDANYFQQKYPRAYQKWTEAEDKLWSSDSGQQLTTIGHLCREAMQEFATALVERYQPPRVHPNTANTVARLKAVLALHSKQLGTTEKAFLEAVIPYWGTVSDLVQRQEHGDQREGRPLV